MTIGELIEFLNCNPRIDYRYNVAVEFVEVGTECETETCIVTGIRLDMSDTRKLVFETDLVGLA